MKVFIVNEEISDQYGTDKVTCVCGTKEIADREARNIKKHRTFIQEFEVIDI
jgi:hypothetical protein